MMYDWETFRQLLRSYPSEVISTESWRGNTLKIDSTRAPNYTLSLIVFPAKKGTNIFIEKIIVTVNDVVVLPKSRLLRRDHNMTGEVIGLESFVYDPSDDGGALLKELLDTMARWDSKGQGPLN